MAPHPQRLGGTLGATLRRAVQQGVVTHRELQAASGGIGFQLVPAGTLAQLPEWAWRMIDDARVGHLGLIDGAGHPRVLPVTYAVAEGAAWTVIDNKPKRPGREPARVGWLRRHPRAAITIDRYDDDWTQLHWVQLLGAVSVLDGPPSGPGITALAVRYPQYRDDPPPGPLLRLSIGRAVWWRAADGV